MWDSLGGRSTVADQLPSSKGTLVGDGWFLTLAWESENLCRALPWPCLPMCHVVCESASPSLAPDSLWKREDGTVG